LLRSSKLSAFAVGALLFSGCSGSGSVPSTPIAAPGGTVTQSSTAGSLSTQAVASLGLQGGGLTDFAAGLASGLFKRSCEIVPGEAHCHAIVVARSGIGFSAQGADAETPDATQAATPAGYGPATLQAAYGTTAAAASGGAGRTVAIVDAYNAATLERDLGVYRTQYGLPPCTTANGCFSKLNQTGGTKLPRNNASWGQETSLDVDMVSANCPNCKILVLEATSPTSANLATAVNTAARLGAVAISNSYGSPESGSDGTYASSYNHPGIAVTVSSGDSGYGVQTPAAYNTVVATGGTTLRGSTETVWSGAGSGCSAYQAKPSWQHDPSCARRTVADVSYDADPNTGVAVYDSTTYQGQGGWLVFGGTSVASPAIGAIYALAGDSFGTSYPASFTYGKYPSGIYDVTSGSNGSCGGTYLCTGKPGYDAPTGLGAPRGLSAF